MERPGGDADSIDTRHLMSWDLWMLPSRRAEDYPYLSGSVIEHAQMRGRLPVQSSENCIATADDRRQSLVA